METLKREPIEWAAATRALAGEARSGDRHLVLALDDAVLVAIVDGIGHGDEAARAADLAIETVEGHAAQGPARLLEICHERLRGTRGVVMSLARIDPERRVMTWSGVGNVEGLILRRDAAGRSVAERLVQRPGVVGARLPALHQRSVPVLPGDLLVFATDGVERGFETAIDGRERPREVAERILDRHGKRTDDATVLVARLRGPS
jgi:serine phosphatase RsbU (regulator of sigma subunit)